MMSTFFFLKMRMFVHTSVFFFAVAPFDVQQSLLLHEHAGFIH